MSDLYDAITKHFRDEQTAADAAARKALADFKPDPELEAVAAAIDDDTAHGRGAWPPNEIARAHAYRNRKRQAQMHQARRTDDPKGAA